jgi:hypothetical protein
MKIFNLGCDYSIVCNSENTRYGFRHLASLIHKCLEIDKTKCCYYNRTWERFEFESVCKKLLKQNEEILNKLMVLNKLNKDSDLSLFGY